MEPIKAPGVKSEINVTPLVDVVLVLLIIFMVVTPMLQKGQAVKLPMTDNPEKKAEDKSQIMVVVSEKHEYWIDKAKMSEAAFPAAIKEAFDRNLNASVVVKADARQIVAKASHRTRKRSRTAESVGPRADSPTGPTVPSLTNVNARSRHAPHMASRRKHWPRSSRARSALARTHAQLHLRVSHDQPARRG